MPKMIPLGLVGNNKNWPGKFCTADGNEVKGVVFGINLERGKNLISGIVETDSGELSHARAIWDHNGEIVEGPLGDLHIGIPAVQANERFLIVDVQTGQTFDEKPYMPSWVDEGRAVLKINADLSLSWISEGEIKDAYEPKKEEV